MRIGQLASLSGVSRDTIRYYEKLGLFHAGAVKRWENNYKNYPSQALARLTQIRQLKELGFTLTEIAALLEVLESNRSPCGNLPVQLDDKLAAFDKKIALLEQYKSKMLAVRQACDGECGKAEGLPDCFSPSTI